MGKHVDDLNWSKFPNEPGATAAAIIRRARRLLVIDSQAKGPIET
jgi:hypothetical protein